MEDCSSPSYDDFGLTQIYLDVGGEYYARDRRLVSQENSLDYPATTGTSSTKCPAVPRTFLNEGSCVRAPGCGIATYSSKEVKLSADLREAMYPTNYVYLVENLPVAEDPCAVNEKSRWVQDSCDDETPDADATLEAAINTDKLVQDVKLHPTPPRPAPRARAASTRSARTASATATPTSTTSTSSPSGSGTTWGTTWSVDWEALHDMADGSANSLTLAAGSTATFTWEETHDVWSSWTRPPTTPAIFRRHGNRWVVGLVGHVCGRGGERGDGQVLRLQRGRWHSLRRRPEDRDHLVR